MFIMIDLIRSSHKHGVDINKRFKPPACGQKCQDIIIILRRHPQFGIGFIYLDENHAAKAMRAMSGTPVLIVKKKN